MTTQVGSIRAAKPANGSAHGPAGRCAPGASKRPFSLVPDRFELSDPFEVFRPAGGPFGDDQCIDVQKVVGAAKHVRFVGMLACDPVVPDATDVAEKIYWTVRRGKGEV